METFKNIYTSACFDLRIEPSYTIVDLLKTLAISRNAERIDLSSHNLGSKVALFDDIGLFLGRFRNCRGDQTRFRISNYRLERLFSRR